MFCRLYEYLLTSIRNYTKTKSSIRLSKKQTIPSNPKEIPMPKVKKNNPHIIKFAKRGESEIKKYSPEDFAEAAEHIYLPGLEFIDEKTFEIVKKQCAHAKEVGFVDEESLWLGALHSKQIKQQYVADVSIQWIDDTLGYGLFAEKDIKAWEYIGEYTGVVRKRNLIFRNVNDYCFSYPTSVLNFRKNTIDAQDKGNELRYANHSDFPNSESNAVLCDDILHIIIRAIRDIPAGTQITYNYTDVYWQSRTRVPNQTETLDH
ncbi:MAG: hypothetical protein ACI9S8_000512 [Chlamydiales bacterium]